jgi:hypothetical protein
MNVAAESPCERDAKTRATGAWIATRLDPSAESEFLIDRIAK